MYLVDETGIDEPLNGGFVVGSTRSLLDGSEDELLVLFGELCGNAVPYLTDAMNHGHAVLTEIEIIGLQDVGLDLPHGFGVGGFCPLGHCLWHSSHEIVLTKHLGEEVVEGVK